MKLPARANNDSGQRFVTVRQIHHPTHHHPPKLRIDLLKRPAPCRPPGSYPYALHSRSFNSIAISSGPQRPPVFPLRKAAAQCPDCAVFNRQRHSGSVRSQSRCDTPSRLQISSPQASTRARSPALAMCGICFNRRTMIRFRPRFHDIAYRCNGRKLEHIFPSLLRNTRFCSA